jgi:hypothetical protein
MVLRAYRGKDNWTKVSKSDGEACTIQWFLIPPAQANANAEFWCFTPL